jgi:phosphatidylglycerol:prolipoprotein diacylglycerol transferase
MPTSGATSWPTTRTADMTFVIPYPAIDPVLFEFGPLVIRWYALAYIAGLLLGLWYMRKLCALPPQRVKPEDVDDFLVWATLGVVLGGRLGYVLFYKPDFYFADPVQILRVWEGGMSFHGGLLGVVIAIGLFVRQRGLRLFVFGDQVAVVAPIGLFFGRLANFINGELFGRPADVPWAMVFPRGGPEPRHPSQLYEATLEGLVLFLIVNAVYRTESLRRRPGFTTGVFFTGYALARMTSEFFREPDAFLGFLFAGATMGQLLSLPVLLIGLYLIFRSKAWPA